MDGRRPATGRSRSCARCSRSPGWRRTSVTSIITSIITMTIIVSINIIITTIMVGKLTLAQICGCSRICG